MALTDSLTRSLFTCEAAVARGDFRAARSAMGYALDRTGIALGCPNAKADASQWAAYIGIVRARIAAMVAEKAAARALFTRNGTWTGSAVAS